MKDGTKDIYFNQLGTYLTTILKNSSPQKKESIISNFYSTILGQSDNPDRTLLNLSIDFFNNCREHTIDFHVAEFIGQTTCCLSRHKLHTSWSQNTLITTLKRYCINHSKSSSGGVNNPVKPLADYFQEQLNTHSLKPEPEYCSRSLPVVSPPAHYHRFTYDIDPCTLGLTPNPAPLVQHLSPQRDPEQIRIEREIAEALSDTLDDTAPDTLTHSPTKTPLSFQSNKI